MFPSFVKKKTLLQDIS